MPVVLHHLCNIPNFTQQAYRYGIALSCIGVLLNWLGVAQTYIEPLRYLGVALVIFGSFLIIAAMCRWMFLAPLTPPQISSRDLAQSTDLQVISIPLSSHSPHLPHHPSADPSSKPPDYQQVMEKPPTYEEAVAIFLSSVPSDSSLPPYSPRSDDGATAEPPPHPPLGASPLKTTGCEESLTGSVSLPAFINGPKVAATAVASIGSKAPHTGGPQSLSSEPVHGENTFNSYRINEVVDRHRTESLTGVSGAADRCHGNAAAEGGAGIRGYPSYSSGDDAASGTDTAQNARLALNEERQQSLDDKILRRAQHTFGSWSAGSAPSTAVTPVTSGGGHEQVLDSGVGSDASFASSRQSDLLLLQQHRSPARQSLTTTPLRSPGHALREETIPLASSMFSRCHAGVHKGALSERNSRPLYSSLLNVCAEPGACGPDGGPAVVLSKSPASQSYPDISGDCV